MSIPCIERQPCTEETSRYSNCLPKALYWSTTAYSNASKTYEEREMYKCAFVKKIISQKNKKEREEYGEENMYKPLLGFWDHTEYTDEAHTDETHLDSTSQCHGMVLREEGHRYDPENIEEVPLKGVRLHIAGWISWWGMAKRLEFYNDEEDELGIQPSRSPKPRFRSTTETKEYAERVKVWDAEKLHKVDKKVQGNAM